MAVSPPAAVETAEPQAQSVVATVSAAVASLFGSGTGDVPVASPIMWALAAAARSQFGSSGSSLTDGNLLRTSADTGEDAGADAMTFSALAVAADPEPALIVDGSVGTGGAPSGVAVSGDKVYVTNQAAGTMTVLKRSDNSVLATVPVGASPSAVVVNSAGTRAYIANSTAGTVTVINTANYSVVTSVKVGLTPTSLALTPDGTRLLVTNAGSNSVTKINTTTNGIATLAVAVGKGPSAIAVSADSKYAYVTNGTDNTVTVITLSYNATNTIAGVGTSPTGVVVGGGKVYVSNLGGTVSVISAASNTVTGQVTVGAPVRSLALSADGATLFAATRSDTVVAIDVATAAVVSTVTTDPTPDTVSTPALAVAADGTIYQTDTTDNALRILHVGTSTGPTNHAPVIGTPVVNAPNAQTGVVTGSIVASDADGDTLTYSVAASATSGTVSVGSNGSFTYTPSLQARQAAGPNTVDQFSVTVSDGQASVTSTVTVKVLPLAVNHAPTVGAPVVGTPDAQTGVVTGSIVASDSDGDTLTYTVTTAPTSGAVSVGANGSFTYTPTTQARQSANANTVDHFTVTVSDGQASVTSAVTVKVLPAPAGGQPGLIVDGSVATGGSPSGVAISGDKVYVTNQGAGTMTVYKRSDNSVLATVAVGASPSAIVVNSAGTRAYVANSTAGTVTVINTTDYSVVTSIKVGTTPGGLALTPDGTRLVVTNFGSNSVTKINTATNGVTTLSVKVGTGPSSVAVSADSAYAYVTNSTGGTVSVITLSVNTVKTITGVGTSPTSVVVGGGKVYVANLGGTVAVISGASNTVTGQVTVGAPVRSLALSADGTRLFAATTTDTVVAINLATAAVISTVATDPSPDAATTPSLAVAADGTIYQTDSTDNALRILHVGIVAPNAAPVVGAPVVNEPNAQSGVVTGSISASDADGDTLTYTVTTGPKYGTLTVGANGSFTYTPSVNARVLADNSPGGQLADQFVVTVSDGRASVTSGVAVAVLPTDALLRTGTYTFEPPVFTSSVKTTMEYTRRRVMEFPTDPYKVRVHIANYNLFNDEFATGGSLDDISMYIGEAALGSDGKPTGAFVPGTQVQIPIASTLAAGQWGVSDWLTDNKDLNFDPDKLYMFSYGFGTPGGKLTSASGGASVGWGSLNAGDAGADAPALTATTAGYLHIWMEYQYADEGKPSIFVVSNSVAYNNSGATGTMGELSTWPNQWAEAMGGIIAGNIAVPAVFSTVFDSPDKRWNFYDGQVEIPLDPDAVIYMAINSSDAASDKNASLMGQIQQHTLEAIEVGNEKFPNALQILSDIPARTGFTTEAMEAERRALNAWTYTLPGGPSGVDAVIRLSDLLGDGGDPERLKPEYTIDGIHWTPAGTAVVVQQIIVTRQAPAAAAIPETVLASLRGLAPATQAVAGSNGACLADPALPCDAGATVTGIQQAVQFATAYSEPIKV